MQKEFKMKILFLIKFSLFIKLDIHTDKFLYIIKMKKSTV